MRLFTFIIYFFASGFGSSFLFAQNAIQEIDSLLDASTQAFDEFENQKSHDLAKLALTKAEVMKISKAVAEANYNIARALGDMGRHRESFEYIEKAEKESFAKKNPLFRAKLSEITATNYMVLNMYPQAIKKYHQTIRLANLSDSPFSKIIRGRAYGNLHVTYYDLENLDSAHYYLDKEINLLKSMDEKEVYASLSLSYLDHGLMLLEEKKNLDSAQHYFQKSLCLLKKYEDPFRQDVFRAMGDLHYEKKEYQEALGYYLETQKIISGLDFYDASYTYILSRISKIYQYLNEPEQAKYYSDKFISLKDSVTSSKLDAVSNVVNDLLNKQEIEARQTRKRNYVVIGLVFLISVIVFSIGLYGYRSKQRNEFEFLNKEELLLTKEKENKLLKRQMNNGLEELVELAKTNNPAFLTRFQEVYPDFCERLMKTYPDLQTSEIKFCALLFLNFSSKDIAEFTFVTLKAVQNRKNRLRKKLEIPLGQDIYIWMQRLS